MNPSRFVAATLLACLLSATAAHAAPSRVSGQVLDAETLKPVPRAEVELQNSGGGPGFFRAVTDGRGEFTIDRVPTDRYYVVTAGADGYTDWAIEGWQFPAAQRDVRLVVPLERAGRIVVRATTSDGHTPVVGARVSVSNERGAMWWEARRRDPAPVWTGKDGSVTIEGLAAGSWTAQVDAPGLRPNELRQVGVRRGETTPVSLVLTRPSSLSGFVRLADSSGVAGVSVVARGPGEATVASDAEGAWTLSDLAPGRWRVEVMHEGFEPGTARDGIALGEGEAKGGVTLTPRPKSPAFSFVIPREVFVPEPLGTDPATAKVIIGVRAFRVPAIDLTLWRVPPARLLDPARGPRGFAAIGADTSGLERVSAWRHEVPAGAPFSWREAQMKLPNELPPGTYVLLGRAGRLEQRQLFFVSDVSMVVKRSGTRLVAWVGSLRTGIALPGVTVVAVASPKLDRLAGGNDWSQALAALTRTAPRTDASGLVSLTPPAGGALARVVAFSERSGVAVVESPRASAATVSGDRMFVFTERPLYLPGQTLYWKLFARKGAGTSYTMPEATAVSLALSGPDGATIDVPSARLSPAGSADGAIEIPKDAPLGEWTLRASAGDAQGAATLGVQHYRKPEFQVEVTPDRAVYVNGDEVRFRVAADYFFGAAVQGARVRWTLFESRLHQEREFGSGDEEEAGDLESAPAAGYGRMLQSGETRTDVDGRLALTFTPAQVAYDRRLALEVEVMDGAQRTVSSRGTALMGRGQFTLAIAPVHWMVVAGQPLEVDVTSKDLLGRPVQAAVTVELDQDVWTPLERRYVRASRPIASLNTTTSASRGTTRVTMAPSVARAGYLTLRVRATDARGNRLVSESHVWVYDANVLNYAYRYPSLEALPDRDRYAPGDTARILVNTDVTDAVVLVSVEGRELHDCRVQPLFGNSGLVKVPILAAYAPNVFVKLHVRRGREVHSRTLDLSVAAARHDLAITVTPDRGTYKPRETAHFSVLTRDSSGMAVPAEVAIGVVDEAIYALRADATPRAHDVFYGRVADAVTTVASFPTIFYGGADKNEAPDIRKDFRDVALWAPTVRTGADGRGEVSLAWPDNLTTWRATARGITDRTLVGESVTRALVTKDIVARLATPRQFIAGDAAELVSAVRNRTDRALRGVKENLDASGGARVSGSSSASGDIGPGSESRRVWAVSVPAESPPDGSDVRARFVFGARSPSDADALEQIVPVRPRAVALPVSAAGAASRGGDRVTVTLPPDLVRSGSAVTLELSPGLGAIAGGATEYLLGYPYGCTEQTSNALRAGAAMAAASARVHAALLSGDLETRLGPLVQRLIALRHDDGAWGWWRAGDSDPFLTALAIDALARAAAAGIQRDAALAAIGDATPGVLRTVGDVREPDGEAYWAMHVATALTLPEAPERFTMLRQGVEGVLVGVLGQREQLSASGLACAAVACASLDRRDDATRLLEAALSRSSTDASGRLVPATSGGDGWYAGDDVEATAYTLLAAATVAPADPRGAELARWLATRRTGPDWRSTRATGPVVLALAAWLSTHPEEAAPPREAETRWNGEPLWRGAVRDSAHSWAPVRIEVPAARLKPGDNTLELAHAGTGTLYWSVLGRANVPSPGPTPDRTRLSIDREYLRATRTADRRGRPRWLTMPLDPGRPLEVGEALLVRLTLHAAQSARWVIVEDPKPTGFEADGVLPDGVDRPWNTAGEDRNDRAVFFLDWLDQGETRVEYLLRPEIGGTFTALPASAGAMYDPTLSTRSGEAKLRVVNP